MAGSVGSVFAQQPPADIPGAEAPGEAGDGEAVALVLRISRLEQALRQANGRIEELENAQHRLEDQLQKFRQDVEFRFGDKAGAAPSANPPQAAAPSAVSAAPTESATPSKLRRSDAFNPDVAPNAPGAPQSLGATTPSAPISRQPSGQPAGAPMDLGGAA